MSRILVAVCLVLCAVAIGLVTYRQAIHEHAPAVIFLKNERVCDCSDEFRDIRRDVRGFIQQTKDFANSVDSLTFEVKDLMTVNELWQQKIEKDWREGSAQMRADIEAAKTYCKQHKPRCGGW